MPKKNPTDPSQPRPAKSRASKVRVMRLLSRPLRDDLTTAEILAATPPATAPRPETGDRKSLGVYDADRDILDQYLYEVSKTPLLTQPQEVAIARKVRTGDEEAMQELVKRNLRFVISVAKKYQTAGSRSPT